MPLLVVPLGPDELGELTLAELDALLECRLVWFEEGGHPLAGRLSAEGVSTKHLASDDHPDPDSDGEALVARPGSGRIVDLARRGAKVTAGAARAPDDLSAAHAAPVARRAAAALGGAAVVMARLRSDDGCPWDREQTHESLKVHLLEEAYEVIDAIDRGLTGADLEEELGDLLLQVAFHARLADQEGRFDVAGVAEHLNAKLVRRHPHVFGNEVVDSAGEVVANWEAIKQTEKNGRDGPFDGVPESLPALLTAYKVQKRAARLGFSVTTDEVRARLRTTLDGGIDAEVVGELLFWLVALARSAGVDPEGALRKATRGFRQSFDSP